MNLRPDIRSGRRQHVPEESQTLPHYVGAVVFLEVILATALSSNSSRLLARRSAVWCLAIPAVRIARRTPVFVDDTLDGVMKSGAARAILRVTRGINCLGTMSSRASSKRGNRTRQQQASPKSGA